MSEIYKKYGIQKGLVPLFDPFDWELKLTNISDIVDSRKNTLLDEIFTEKYSYFRETIQQNLDEVFRSKIAKLSSDADSERNLLEKEYNDNKHTNITAKITELDNILSNGLGKLVQKQDANKYITDVIDRDEGIKMACMRSLYDIYQSFLNPELLLHLINMFGKGSLLANLTYMKKVTIDAKTSKDREEQFVFNQTHDLFQTEQQFIDNTLKNMAAGISININEEIVDAIKSIPQDSPEEYGFEYNYLTFLAVYTTAYPTYTGVETLQTNLQKFYFAFLQDFFIFYVKGSGALYLLFTDNVNHMKFVQSANVEGDLNDLSPDKTCPYKEITKGTDTEPEAINMIDMRKAFENLKLGNSDWDLNLCINPGIYSESYDTFKSIYNSLLWWNRRQMYECREKYFIPLGPDYTNKFLQQVNCDILTKIAEDEPNTNKFTINQTKTGLAFINRTEIDATIYRVVSDEIYLVVPDANLDALNSEEKNQFQGKVLSTLANVGKVYRNPWLGKPTTSKSDDTSLLDIINDKKTYEEVLKYITGLYVEN